MTVVAGVSGEAFCGSVWRLRHCTTPQRRRERLRLRQLCVRGQKTEVAFPAAPITIPEGDWRILQGGVTAPRGFRAAGVAAGLRSSGTRPDLSLVISEVPALTAGVFTQNILCAAPVLYDKRILDRNTHVRAVLTNAGQANAATGPEGMSDAETSAEAVADLLGIQSEEVLVMSTGVIGHRIKMDPLLSHLPHLSRSLATGSSTDIDVATAITTTDLAYKTAAVEVEIEGQVVTLGGMCKGSGMIHPSMATLLGLVTCDAPIEAQTWKQLFVKAMDLSFNRITVDGDTSTNDTILGLTSGMAEIPVISDAAGEAGRKLQDAMTALCQGLAKSVAWDGEGATCLIEVTVTGADTSSDALTIAKSVASSMLTKAAVFGHDPNWGRIGAAAGYAGVPFSVEQLSITLGSIELMHNGVPSEFDRQSASDYLKEQCGKRGTVQIGVSIGRGPGRGVAWGCDLSYDYVRINAEYTT